MEDPSPMEQALRNPVVLQQIFQHTNMEIRLVCKLWNEVFLSLPEPKQILNLYGLKDGYCDPQPFQFFCCDMTPKLARNIKVSGDYLNDPKCHTFNSAAAAITAGSMLIHICDKFGDLIQFLDLDVEADLMYKILKKSTFCENLKSLVIRDYKDCVGKIEPLPLRTKLVSMYLKINYNSEALSIVPSGLAQLIINSAQNLEKLELSSTHYFPDLSGSHQLRTLIIPYGVELQELDFFEFYRMLNQVAERLEVLEIGDEDSMNLADDWDFDGKIDPPGFQMPSCPRLKIFVNQFVEVFHCGDALQDLNAERFPSLRYLQLVYGNCDSSDSADNEDSLLKKVLENKTTLNVTSLYLNGLDNVSLLANSRTSFPHLRKFKLDLNFNGMSGGDPDLPTFDALLKACTTLGLSHLAVELETCPATVLKYMNCFLDNRELFKILRTISMVWDENPSTRGRFNDNPLKTVEGWNRMQEFLRIFAGMESALVFPPVPKDAWWTRVAQFIQENKLPVQLKWC